jgi:hypothetical protein
VFVCVCLWHAGEQPVTRALGAVKEWTRPDYWVPDELVIECTGCRRIFNKGERKHHCRSCGQGFCGACSQGRACVPNRGWHTPVRVCAKCMDWLASCEDVACALETAPASTPRAADDQSDGAHDTHTCRDFEDDDDEDWGVIANEASALPDDTQCQDVWSAVYVPVTKVQAPNLPRKGVEHIVDAVQVRVDMQLACLSHIVFMVCLFFMVI